MPRQQPRMFLIALWIMLLLGSASSAMAQMQFFAYQGQYTNNAIPSEGNLNFRFRLFDAEDNGNLLGEPVYLNGVTVMNGAFDVDLPLGHLFGSEPLWLEVRIEDVVLPARQEIPPPN